jgi:translation initiation factor IF-1
MPQKQAIRREGIVVESLPSLTFKVKMNDSGEEILGHLSGRLRINRIKILPGDKVTVEFGSYDQNKGRIVYRGK